MTDDERALVDAARRGDDAAVDQLLRTHQPAVYAICRRILGTDADALDATQEALIAIVRGLDRFDGRSKVSTWVYRIATNCCLDEVRRRGRRPTPGLPDESSSEPSRIEEQVAARVDVDHLLQQLPLDFRIAVVLRDLCSLDYREIARVLDIPPGTVRSRIARGRALMAQQLGGNHDPTTRRQTERP